MKATEPRRRQAPRRAMQSLLSRQAQPSTLGALPPSLPPSLPDSTRLDRQQLHFVILFFCGQTPGEDSSTDARFEFPCRCSCEHNDPSFFPEPANIMPLDKKDSKEGVPSTTTTTTTVPAPSIEPQEQDGPDSRSKATVSAPLSGLAPPAPAPTDSSSSSPSTSLSASAPLTNATNGDGGRRKSVRSTRSKVDYANLNQHLPASVDRWISTIDARTQSGQIVSGFAAAATTGLGWRRFENGHELEKMGDEWIYGSSSSARTSAGEGSGGGVGAQVSGGGEGMMEPFVVESPEGLGMEMPKAGISVRVVADLVGELPPPFLQLHISPILTSPRNSEKGPDTPLEVIDCASQSSLSNWTLGQWADYYDDPQRDKVRNVISLEVSDSKLGKMITAPNLVR